MKMTARIRLVWLNLLDKMDKEFIIFNNEKAKYRDRVNSLVDTINKTDDLLEKIKNIAQFLTVFCDLNERVHLQTCACIPDEMYGGGYEQAENHNVLISKFMVENYESTVQVSSNVKTFKFGGDNSFFTTEYNEANSVTPDQKNTKIVISAVLKNNTIMPLVDLDTNRAVISCGFKNGCFEIYNTWGGCPEPCVFRIFG